MHQPGNISWFVVVVHDRRIQEHRLPSMLGTSRVDNCVAFSLALILSNKFWRLQHKSVVLGFHLAVFIIPSPSTPATMDVTKAM